MLQISSANKDNILKVSEGISRQIFLFYQQTLGQAKISLSFANGTLSDDSDNSDGADAPLSYPHIYIHLSTKSSNNKFPSL